LGPTTTGPAGCPRLARWGRVSRRGRASHPRSVAFRSPHRRCLHGSTPPPWKVAPQREFGLLLPFHGPNILNLPDQLPSTPKHTEYLRVTFPQPESLGSFFREFFWEPYFVGSPETTRGGGVPPTPSGWVPAGPPPLGSEKQACLGGGTPAPHRMCGARSRAIVTIQYYTAGHCAPGGRVTVPRRKQIPIHWPSSVIRARKKSEPHSNPTGGHRHIQMKRHPRA